MPTLDERIRSAVLSDAAIAAKIGARMYQILLPGNILKKLLDLSNAVGTAITFQTIVDQPAAVTQDGVTSMGNCRIGFTIYDVDIISADDTATQLKRVMKSLNLTNGNGRPTIYVMDRSGVEPNTEPPVWKRFVDFTALYDNQ